MTAGTKKVDIVLATGGTAGHIFPALAVATELERRSLSFHFVTSQKGIANNYLEENYSKDSITRLAVRGFKISKNPISGLSTNIHALKELSTARRQAKKLLKERQPRIVVSTGGYAALPTGLAARAEKIPLMVMESNVVPGRASKFLSKKAEVSAVGFVQCQLPRSLHSGIPVRESILAVDRKKNQAKAKKQLGVEELVVVVGGSLGSTKLNQILLASKDKLLERKSLSIFHIVGERDWDLIAKEQNKKNNYKVIKFESNMENLFEAADLFVSRAGANIIAELEVTKTPSILIPWSEAAANHQLANAQSYCEIKNKTELILEKDLTPENLVKKILEFFIVDGVDTVKEKNITNITKGKQASKTIVDFLEQYC